MKSASPEPIGTDKVPLIIYASTVPYDPLTDPEVAPLLAEGERVAAETLRSLEQGLEQAGRGEGRILTDAELAKGMSPELQRFLIIAAFLLGLMLG